MSNTKTIKDPSPLVLAVLAIDEHFADLKRLSSRIDAIDLKSNFDAEQSQRLITHYAQSGQALSQDIARFVQVLTDARAEAEMDAQKVSARADELHARKENVADKMAQFHALSEKVRLLNESLIEFKRPTGDALSELDQTNLKLRLSDVASQLGGFIEEAQSLKEVGRQSNLKILEQNADSMRQSLVAVSQKISGMLNLS